MDERCIQKEGAMTYYWTAGRGPKCIVFLHGALADHRLFDEQINAFVKDHKVIVVDIPAHGRSRPFLNFSLGTAAEHVIKVLDAEQVSSAHVVGQSMGGYIAQIIAYTAGERVDSLTMIGSSPLQQQYYSKLDDWLLALTPSLLSLSPYRWLIRAIADQVSVTEAGRRYMLETLTQYTKAEIATIMRTVYMDIKAIRNYGPLPVSTLITYGAFDTTGKVRIYSKEWARQEQLPLTVIPNAAHNANFDNPNFFNQVLLRFISGQQTNK